MSSNRNFFTKTVADESGFSDPLGDCTNNFDILQFINEDAPIDSPTDSRYIQQHILQNFNNNNNGINQNLNVQAVNNSYSNSCIMSRINNGRLPDSPPITDISAGGLSSASPSSGGSASGDSPFSPSSSDPYNQLYNQQNGSVLLTMPGLNKVATNESNRNNEEVFQNQIHLTQRLVMQPQRISNQSEFLSPYPPSQLTPGSQHSSNSAQISPSGLIIENQTNNNYIIQQQTQQYSVYRDNEINSPHVQAGYKRRRITNNSSSPNTTFTNVKCENGMYNCTNNTNHLLDQQQNRNFLQFQQKGRNGTTNGNEIVNQNLADLPSLPQTQPPPPPSSHHSMDGDSDEASIGLQKTIKFTPFFPDTWTRLYDSHQCPIDELKVHIVADKGFNFSPSDNCFVNQKKNHFQITVQIDKVNSNPPFYVRMANNELHIVNDFLLVFGGAKFEMPNAELVSINQSQADRKPVPHEGVKFKIDACASTKLTVQRLHFSQTTLCNHRKNGKPNPEQKYFLLVLKIMARAASDLILIQSYQSDRVIVRASNPGQFEQAETDTQWQRSEKLNANVLHFNGQVAIGTDTPVNDAKLTVKGNLVATGLVMHPSDRRVKENISEVDTNEALSRISQMRIVEYEFKPEVAREWGLTEENRHRVGVIAQELEEVLPEAVQDNGEFLTVDDTRVFYDTVAAAQELYRLTGNLECKIDQVEKISQKLARFAQKRKDRGSIASGISGFSNFINGGLSNENKNFISHSRTSLTSAPAAPYIINNCAKKSEKNKRHSALNNESYRRCRSISSVSSYAYCHRDRNSESALCTSRVTQGTIVTLVIIMALCLMAMCTLYVMDWYNRTYIYAPHHYYHSHGIMQPDYGIKRGNYLNIAPSSTANGVSENGLGHIVEKIIWTPPKESLAAPLADGCTAPRSHCPIFCCGAPRSHLLEGISALNNVKKTSLFTVNKMDAITPLTKLVMTLPYQTKDLSNNFNNNRGNLKTNVKIQILNLNATIDSKYCRNELGCDFRKGLFNLDVPISPFLPTIPLLLKFSVEDDLFVDNCGFQEFKYKLCEFEHEPGINLAFINPTSRRINGNTFELPVGNFLLSAFIFRIGYTSNSCQMTENHLGRSFDEYKLVFYRTCGKE